MRYNKAISSADDCHRKGSLSLTDPKRRIPYHGRATWGSSRVGQEAEGGGNVGESLYRGFHEKEQARQGQQVQGWLLWVISGLWV